jgi:hypothetical protein
VIILAGLAIATLAAFAGQQPLPSTPPPTPPSASAAPAPAAATPADASAAQAGKPAPGAVAAEVKIQPAVEQSQTLLKLATDLKTEVDKTNQDTLSLSVIRKAGEIERLAHAVREKAKLTAAANRGGAS